MNIGSPRSVMANVLDCDLVVREFEILEQYYVHFRTNSPGKGKNFFIPSVMGYIILLLFCCKDGFGIK